VLIKAKAKFCSSAQNFTARGKLWALIIAIASFSALTLLVEQQKGHRPEKTLHQNLATGGAQAVVPYGNPICQHN